MVRVTVQ
jgi:Transposase zinc-binding domain/Putative transposase